MEYCYRAFKKGFKSVYFPDAKIIHHSGVSGKKNPDVRISNQVLTKIKYFRKNHSKAEFIVVLVFRFLHIVSRMLILNVVSIFNRSYLAKAKAYVFTLKRFMKNNY